MSLLASWLRGVLTHRLGRLLAVICGVGLTIAFLASLATFVVSGSASLTQRAIADVPVDWQLQLNPGTDLSATKAALGQAIAFSALEQVGYAAVDGFSASTGDTVQTTGTGKVLGLGPGYRKTFPAEVRSLVGGTDGVLVAQQTAANLRVQPGDTVTITRLELPPVSVSARPQEPPRLPNALMVESLPVVASVPSPPGTTAASLSAASRSLSRTGAGSAPPSRTR